MDAAYYRRQLDRKRKQRLDSEKRAGAYRTTESTKRTQAAQARLIAAQARSEPTKRTKVREADRREKEAATAGAEANRWQTRATRYAREEAALQFKVTRAELDDARALDRRRSAEVRRNELESIGRSDELSERIDRAEGAIRHVLEKSREPRIEKLRVLLIGSSSEGDLRVGREQQRIRDAVTAARHRDRIEFDPRPAATASDLLDGVTGFRPHIVHFSGHSSADVIELEDDSDLPHRAVVVTAEAFARALMATDAPPTLVVLNACNSSAHLNYLTTHVVPFAIGMIDEIDDADAIVYAAQLYASITNGQSIAASHRAGRAALELAGLRGAELPILASAEGSDPAQTVLIKVVNDS